jgi:co-chaperonin GroES (HSP10)
MKTLEKFIVKIPKRINDTKVLENGVELYIDNRFNEFEHRVTSGEVLSVPYKYKLDVKVGDTLYFHHLVVLNGGQSITGMEDSYLVQYDEGNPLNSQAIAYKSKNTGDIFPLGGWSLLEFVEEKDDLTSDSISLVNLKEKLPTKGKISFDAEWINELGVFSGDVVGFKENMDYRIDVDGKEYYRVDPSDFLYVEEEVHNG